MYGSWTENVVLWRIFQESVETYKTLLRLHICLARAQIQSLKSWKIVHLKKWFWESVLKKLFNNVTTTVVKILQ